MGLESPEPPSFCQVEGSRKERSVVVGAATHQGLEILVCGEFHGHWNIFCMS